MDQQLLAYYQGLADAATAMGADPFGGVSDGFAGYYDSSGGYTDPGALAALRSSPY